MYLDKIANTSIHYEYVLKKIGDSMENLIYRRVSLLLDDKTFEAMENCRTRYKENDPYKKAISKHCFLRAAIRYLCEDENIAQERLTQEYYRRSIDRKECLSEVSEEEKYKSEIYRLKKKVDKLEFDLMVSRAK